MHKKHNLQLHEFIVDIFLIIIGILSALDSGIKIDLELILGNIFLRYYCIFFINITLSFIIFQGIARKISGAVNKKLAGQNFLNNLYNNAKPAFLPLIYIFASILQLLALNSLDTPSFIFLLSGFILGIPLAFELTDDDIIKSIQLIDVMKIIGFFILAIAVVALFSILYMSDYTFFKGCLLLVLLILVAGIIWIKNRSHSNTVTQSKRITRLFYWLNRGTIIAARYILPVIFFFMLEIWHRSIYNHFVIANPGIGTVILLVLSGIVPLRLFLIFYNNKSWINKIISTIAVSVYLFLIIRY